MPTSLHNIQDISLFLWNKTFYPKLKDKTGLDWGKNKDLSIPLFDRLGTECSQHLSDAQNKSSSTSNKCICMQLQCASLMFTSLSFSTVEKCEFDHLENQTPITGLFQPDVK